MRDDPVALILAIRPPYDPVLRFDALPFLWGVAQFGAVIGAVATPLLGFGALRRIPLGHAVAVAGFVIAGLHLRPTGRRARSVGSVEEAV